MSTLLEQPQLGRTALHSHSPSSDASPARRRAILSSDVDGAITPLDGVGAAVARLVGVFQLLDLTLVRHERVRHHAVHEQHERRGGAVYEGAQAPHRHHHLVLPGGKTELQQRNHWENYIFLLSSTMQIWLVPQSVKLQY